MKIRISKAGGWERLRCLWREAVSSVWGILPLRAPKPLLCLQKQLHFTLVALWGRTVIGWEVDFPTFSVQFKTQKTQIQITSKLNSNLKKALFAYTETASALLHAGALLLMCFSQDLAKKNPQFIKCFPLSTHHIPASWWNLLGAIQLQELRLHQETPEGEGYQPDKKTRVRITLAAVLLGIPRAQGIQEEIPQEVLCQVLPWLPPPLQCCVTILWSTRNIRGFIIPTSISPGSWHKTSLFF